MINCNAPGTKSISIWGIIIDDSATLEASAIPANIKKETPAPAALPSALSESFTALFSMLSEVMIFFNSLGANHIVKNRVNKAMTTTPSKRAKVKLLKPRISSIQKADSVALS
jgi:hypothetical protein